MARDWTPKEIREIPAIILLGMQEAGKTETLRSWMRPSPIEDKFNVSSEGDVEEWQNPEQMATGFVQEYCFKLDDEVFRVIDVPGEITNPDNPQSSVWLEEVGKRAGTVGAFLLIVEPGTDAQDGGGVARPENMKTAFTADQTLMRFNDHTLSTATTLREKFGVQQDGLSWAVQIGFSDALVFGGSDEENRRLRREYSETCNLWMPTTEPFSFREKAIERRLDHYDSISDKAKEAYASLIEKILERRGELDPFVYLQSNRDHGGHQCRLGLIYFADQMYGKPKLEAAAEEKREQRRRKELDEKSRRATRRRRVGVAIGLTIACYLLCFPALQPSCLAVQTCLLAPGPKISTKCGCVPVLADEMASRTPPWPATDRLRPIAPYLSFCRADKSSRDGELASTLLRVELLRAIAEPEQVRLDKMRELIAAGARWQTSGEALDISPLIASEQTLAGFLLDATKTNERRRADGELLLRALSSEAVAHREAVSQVERASRVVPCIESWAAARAKGNWADAQGNCSSATRRAMSLPMVRLLQADMPPPLSRIREMDRDAVPRAIAGSSLFDLLVPVPAPDGLTWANAAAGSDDGNAFSSFLDRGRKAHEAKLDGIHARVLEALAPGNTARPGWLDDVNDVRKATTLASGAVLADTPPGTMTRVYHAASALKDGRVVVLPAATGKQLACNIEPRLGTWPSFFPVPDRGIEIARAVLKIQLLKSVSDQDDPEGSACRAAAQLELLRSSEQTYADVRVGLVERLRTVQPTVPRARLPLCAVLVRNKNLAKDGEIQQLVEMLRGADVAGAHHCATYDVLSLLAEEAYEDAEDIMSKWSTLWTTGESVVLAKTVRLLRALQEAEEALEPGESFSPAPEHADEVEEPLEPETTHDSFLASATPPDDAVPETVPEDTETVDTSPDARRALRAALLKTFDAAAFDPALKQLLRRLPTE